MVKSALECFLSTVGAHHLLITFSSYEVESGATSGAEEASSGEGKACEEGGALWESAQL